MEKLVLDICQYAGSVSGLIGFFYIEQKKKFGWIVWFCSTTLVVLWLACTSEQTKGYGVLVMQMFYLVANVRGWIKWKKEDLREQEILRKNCSSNCGCSK